MYGKTLKCYIIKMVLNRNQFPIFIKIINNYRIELNSLNDVLGNCTNLGQGFPDFQPAPEIIAELEKVCRADPNLHAFHQYARAYVRNLSERVVM